MEGPTVSEVDVQAASEDKGRVIVEVVGLLPSGGGGGGSDTGGRGG